VRTSGQIKWKGRNPQITEALIGQEIGLKPAGEGQWKIYFEGLELGTFDERHHRLRPAARLTPNPHRS
jgi:putative transposase